tara:strand:+ start:1842 stop:2540 length:699 start_codon:yes stop_codon:yes gene_type:complete
MIRTRDFLLYVIGLVLLLLGTIATGVLRVDNGEVYVSTPYFDLIPTTPEAVLPETEVNKADRLAWFRSLIKVDPIPEETIEKDTVQEIVYCSGSRKIIPTVSIGKIVADGSAVSLFFSETEEIPFASLPLRSIRSTFDTCLPDNLIGVSAVRTDGLYRPILNSDIAMYLNYGENDLVGYMRDGLPLYGVVSDEVELDSCGGRYVNYSYRYQIQSNREGLILCYAGLPAELKL